MTVSGAWSLMRASMSCDLIAPDAAMLMLLFLCLCSVPTARDYASNILTKLDVVDWPQARVTGRGAGFDDAVVPPHDGAVERSPDHG
jgi:hypothetical protein